MRYIKTGLIILGLAFFLLPMVFGQSDDIFEKAKVLDNPLYPLDKSFALSLDFSWLPQDSFYKPLFLEAAGTYSWSDFFGLEARGGYLLSANSTGLDRTLSDTVGRQIETEGTLFKDVQLKASVAALLHFFYSKSNFFNKKIVYHYWSFGMGPGFLKAEAESQLGIEASLQLHIFLWKQSMLNIRTAYLRGFQSGLSKDILSLGFGAGWLF